jgi:predicted 3-demethylubiquinone-9 3-methyltransferase (glyoxalase superfamily)
MVASLKQPATIKPNSQGDTMSKINTFITYNDQAEEAVKLYTSVFKNSWIVSLNRYPDEVPGLGGKAMSINFVLEGQELLALNGGPHFTFTDGFSLLVNCETQAEVDEYWEKLSAGGEPGQCGWLKDKFGVSWQIIPSVLGRLLGDKDPRKAQNVMQAMLQMSKIDIAALQQAYDQA